jgi:hypothetical protein
MEDITEMAHSLVLETHRLASTTPDIISGVLPSSIFELDGAIYLFNSYVQNFLLEINSKSVFYFLNENFIRHRKIQHTFTGTTSTYTVNMEQVFYHKDIIHAMITSKFGITLTEVIVQPTSYIQAAIIRKT